MPNQNNLTIHEQMSEFITTNGDVHFLPLLNKFEKATLAQVSTGFNAAVNSSQLFTTIVTAIKEVEEQARTSSSSRQSIKDIRKKSSASASSTVAETDDAASEKKAAKLISSRQIPMHARLEATNKKGHPEATPQAAAVG
mmetsp:Transcript_28895/g.35701  ORF Transcript_28895/g.35701 Transcript_28895/m.35701 type:complete len:140 (+) Transcript_28895:108-527(+)